jgi:basic membrane protein A and related proteins
MRNTRFLGAAVVAAAALLLAACSGQAGPADSSGSAKSGSVALMIPGTSGDGGFFDQAIAGVKKGAAASGWKAQIVEAGYEPTKWQPAMDDLANGSADVVITGSFAMVDIVEQEAAQHPDKKFVLFDSAIDKSKCGGCTNVYSITYRYDETGFLAGALAGLLETTPGIENVHNTKIVGVVGGQDIPVINDYISGYKLGVKSVAPDVKVLSAYAGSFADPVKGKAVGQDMVNQGADVLFSAAGATDNGVFEAAADNKIWALGNAAAQADKPQVDGTDAVLTASDTNVVSSMEDAVKLAAAGKLPLDTTRNYGVKDGSVDITDSALYQRVVPRAIRDKIDAITKDVAAGKYESQFTK